jgi:hypothetical protein
MTQGEVTATIKHNAYSSLAVGEKQTPNNYKGEIAEIYKTSSSIAKGDSAIIALSQN